MVEPARLKREVRHGLNLPRTASFRCVEAVKAAAAAAAAFSVSRVSSFMSPLVRESERQSSATRMCHPHTRCPTETLLQKALGPHFPTSAKKSALVSRGSAPFLHSEMKSPHSRQDRCQQPGQLCLASPLVPAPRSCPPRRGAGVEGCCQHGPSLRSRCQPLAALPEKISPGKTCAKHAVGATDWLNPPVGRMLPGAGPPGATDTL